MTTAQQPLSNVQMELLKLYAMDVPEDDLLHFKNYFAHFYMQKAIKEADEIWNKKKYTNELMNNWLNEEKQ